MTLERERTRGDTPTGWGDVIAALVMGVLVCAVLVGVTVAAFWLMDWWGTFYN